MMYLICYDISDNYLRQKLAKQLIRKGLVRFQYSVFMGSLPPRRYGLLQKWVKQQIPLKQKDQIAIIPILKRELLQMMHLGRFPVEVQEVLDEPHTLIL